jgi:hypothetical protein
MAGVMREQVCKEVISYIYVRQVRWFNRQVPRVQFLLALLLPLGLDWVPAVLCPSCWWVQVMLVCLHLTLKPCVKQ